MTIIDQVVTLHHWGYKNRDIEELIGASKATVAVSWWKYRNREASNLFALQSYYRNRDKRLAAAREQLKKRKLEDPEWYKEYLYKRKLRSAGVAYPCQGKSMSHHHGETNTKTASLEP